MDENNTPQSSEPTPTPEPEVPPTTPPTPPDPAPAVSPSSTSTSTSADYPRDAVAGKGPVPFAGPADPSIPSDEKMQALLCWVLSLFASFIAPLIFLLISKDKPFVYHHAAQCLALSIVSAVIAIICLVSCVGAVLLPFLSLAVLAVVIMGAIAANAGARFEPPLTSGISKSLFKA